MKPSATVNISHLMIDSSVAFGINGTRGTVVVMTAEVCFAFVVYFQRQNSKFSDNAQPIVLGPVADWK